VIVNLQLLHRTLFEFISCVQFWHLYPLAFLRGTWKVGADR